MKDTLIIVESPAKAKTISKFLDGVDVIASKGHIRDLPVHTFGIHIENGKYTPQYEITAGHGSIVKEIKYLAKNKKVYLASDEDREGEAIGYHIASILGGNPLDYDRIVFHEITKTAILKAIEHPRKLNMHAVEAQEARRMLDRIVGYKLSPLLSKKIEGKLSAGRVQSATLKLVYDREKEIQAFLPIEYFDITGKFNSDIPASLHALNSKIVKKYDITTKEEADKILNKAKASKWSVRSIDQKKKKTSPKPPFTTSTLQQTASSILGFAPDRTMSAAQRLYEGVDTPNGQKGVITYMRTDSLNLAAEAVAAIRAEIDKQFGHRYVSEQPRVYATKSKGAQEAHEAIRVTDVTFTPKIAERFLEGDHLKLYTLVYNRTMMCQMADGEASTVSAYFTTEDNSIDMVAKGRTVLFDGWNKLNPDAKGDVELPPLEVNQVVSLTSIAAEQKATEPPARYTQASIVKAMEDAGIGRPSTYAATVSLLVKRVYVRVESNSLVITDRGNKIIEFLDKYFPEITDVNFTSKMEENLDQVALGEANLHKVLGEYSEPLLQKIKDGYEAIPSQKVSIALEELCPKCGNHLVKRIGSFGEMIGCSNYPKCKYIKPREETAEKADFSCPICGSEVLKRKGKFGDYYACKNYKEKCSFVSSHPVAKDKCPKCGNWQQERPSKFEGGSSYIRCLKCNPPKPRVKSKKGKK